MMLDGRRPHVHTCMAPSVHAHVNSMCPTLRACTPLTPRPTGHPTRCRAHRRERKNICSSTRPYAHDALDRQHLQHDDAQQQVLHNIVHIFFSTCRHALRARTTMAAAPAREPAHAARATPPHAHMHAQLASQQAHTHLHITTASTARFYAVTHGNKTARLRAVNRPAFARCILPLNSLSLISKRSGAWLTTRLS